MGTSGGELGGESGEGCSGEGDGGIKGEGEAEGGGFEGEAEGGGAKGEEGGSMSEGGQDEDSGGVDGGTWVPKAHSCASLSIEGAQSHPADTVAGSPNSV